MRRRGREKLDQGMVPKAAKRLHLLHIAFVTIWLRFFSLRMPTY